MNLLIIITLVAAVVIAEKVRFDHYRVHRIIPTKKAQVKALALLKRKNEVSTPEWVAPAGTSWFINEIVEGSVDPVFKRFNYLYFPVYNPDGYVNSWTTNRLWRKTPYHGGVCYGADGNSNWDSDWNGPGCSQDPCADNYAGPRVFSELETKSMSNYLKKVSRARKQDIFLSYHNYGQMISYPWGWTSTPARNEKIFNKVAVDAAKALTAVNGTIFTVGSSYNVIYPISGTSNDWYYQYFNGTIVLNYQIRDTGYYGVLLPSEFIIPFGKEHLASLQKILLDYEEVKK